MHRLTNDTFGSPIRWICFCLHTWNAMPIVLTLAAIFGICIDEEAAFCQWATDNFGFGFVLLLSSLTKLLATIFIYVYVLLASAMWPHLEWITEYWWDTYVSQRCIEYLHGNWPSEIVCSTVLPIICSWLSHGIHVHKCTDLCSCQQILRLCDKQSERFAFVACNKIDLCV